MSTYPCLQSPVTSPGSRPLPAPFARARTLVLSVLLTAAATRSARTRAEG